MNRAPSRLYRLLDWTRRTMDRGRIMTDAIVVNKKAALLLRIEARIAKDKAAVAILQARRTGEDIGKALRELSNGQAELEAMNAALSDALADLQLDREARRAKLARAAARSSWLLDFATVWVPARIANEEVGDAVQQMVRYADEGRPAWWLYAKAVSYVFWTAVHAISDVVSRMRKSSR